MVTGLRHGGHYELGWTEGWWDRTGGTGQYGVKEGNQGNRGNPPHIRR